MPSVLMATFDPAANRLARRLRVLTIERRYAFSRSGFITFLGNEGCSLANDLTGAPVALAKRWRCLQFPALSLSATKCEDKGDVSNPQVISSRVSSTSSEELSNVGEQLQRPARWEEVLATLPPDVGETFGTLVEDFAQSCWLEDL